VLSVSDDETARAWDWRTGKPVTPPLVLGAHPLGGSSTTPLYKAVQKLAKETVARLHMVIPPEEAIEAEEPVNAVATQNW
jgi:hypothetical protein